MLYSKEGLQIQVQSTEEQLKVLWEMPLEELEKQPLAYLYDGITQWSAKAGLLSTDGTSVVDQLNKHAEEDGGEFIKNLYANNTDKLPDDIGDMFVCFNNVYYLCKGKYENMIRELYSPMPNEDKSVKWLACSLRAEINDAMYGCLRDFEHEAVVASFKILADKLGFTLEQCLAKAFYDIRNRELVLHEGIAYKKGTPEYEQYKK